MREFRLATRVRLGAEALEALDEAGRTDLLALSQALTARNA